MTNYRNTCEALKFSFCQGGSWRSGNDLVGGGVGGGGSERVEGKGCTSKKQHVRVSNPTLSYVLDHIGF